MAGSINTLIQLTADDNVRGRVMSLFSMTFIGLMPVGSLLAGALAHSLGGSITVGLFALSVLFGAFVYVRFAQRQGVDTDVASPTAGTSKVLSGERLTCRKDV